MAMPNKPPSLRTAPRAQRGAVLVVALIFLILLTILAISASGRSLLQERMAGGLLNAQQAEMSAQTALRGAEWKLWTNAVRTITGGGMECTLGVFSTDCYKFVPGSPNTNVVNFRTKSGWVTAGATEYKGYDNSVDYSSAGEGKLARNPWYIIEDMGQVRPENVGPAQECGATGSCPGGADESTLHIYRITARGTGGSANTVRVQESTFMAVKVKAGT
ncbi:MAG: pilus assembly PilX family protein [Rhodanobacter sp.]